LRYNDPGRAAKPKREVMNMMLDMGRRIRELRVKRGISQEKLAGRLGVSFQAVSKWENGVSLPDIALIPIIADTFEVSTDELFGVNRMERERRIEAVCAEAAALRDDAPERAEALLREALERYPGDEVLLNNLLYTIRGLERRQEVVRLCRLLVENSTRYDDVKYDALRILAETCAELGERALARQAVEQIPEIYFTKLGVAAMVLDGEEALSAARRQRSLSAELLLRMLKRLAALQGAAGQVEAAGESEALRARLLEVIGDLPDPFRPGTLGENA